MKPFVTFLCTTACACFLLATRRSGIKESACNFARLARQMGNPHGCHRNRPYEVWNNFPSHRARTDVRTRPKTQAVYTLSGRPSILPPGGRGEKDDSTMTGNKENWEATTVCGRTENMIVRSPENTKASETCPYTPAHKALDAKASRSESGEKNASPSPPPR